MPKHSHLEAVEYFHEADNPLSNSWLFPLKVKLQAEQETVFRSVEHAYQYFKGKCGSASEKMLQQILDAPTAEKARDNAKKVHFSDKKWKTWEENRVLVMKALLELKYTQSEMFRKKLIPSVLYTETTLDKFWGMGNPPTQTGQNILGRLLTTLAQYKTLREPETMD